MKELFHGLLKLVSLVTGTLCCAGGGYLCYLQNKEYGWFLFCGLILIVSTMIWCANSDNK